MYVVSFPTVFHYNSVCLVVKQKEISILDPQCWFLHFRTILAILHFYENLKRQTMTTKEGEPYFHVVYPKYKLGEEIVRQVAVPPSYGMSHANLTES